MTYTSMNLSRSKLKLLLVDNNLSISQLADKSGISKQTLYRIFRTGKTTTRTASKLCKALDVNVREVVNNVR